MYPKIQSQGIAAGPNNGSCAAYAYYLGHENRWKKDNGKRSECIPFYDTNGDEVSVETVISSIDSNKRGLHVEDAKFYSLIISPSEKEASRLGTKREEKLISIQTMVEKMMDRYAAGFGKDEIKSHENLLYYYTIHEYREDDTGMLLPGIHVHMIVSRKSNDGRYKLSPMTNHRGETKGVIKSGFNRDTFYRDCERIFDKTFSYERRIAESYDYLNAMKHGSQETKSALIRAAIHEENICEQISKSLATRAARLAREVASQKAQKEREAWQALQSENKKKRDKFWNSYNSYYRPLLDKLNDECQSTYTLYSSLKNEKADLSDDITTQFRELKTTYELISKKREELEKVEDYEDLVKAFTFIMVLANPFPMMILSLVLMIILDVKKGDAKTDIQIFRSHADQIRENIEDLKAEQKKLQCAQQDTLSHYIQVKDQKNELKKQLEQLRHELEQPEKTIDLDTLSMELAERKKTTVEPSVTQIFAAYGVYGAMMSAKTKLDLDLDMLANNIVIDPVFHPNGGVADFSVAIKNISSKASDTYSDEKLAAMIEKWCELTGNTPAHRISTKDEPNKSLSTKTIQTNKDTLKTKYNGQQGIA